MLDDMKTLHKEANLNQMELGFYFEPIMKKSQLSLFINQGPDIGISISASGYTEYVVYLKTGVSQHEKPLKLKFSHQN